MSIVFVGVACQAPGKKAKERYNLVAAGSTHEVRVSMGDGRHGHTRAPTPTSLPHVCA